jgi:hypothetical protein
MAPSRCRVYHTAMRSRHLVGVFLLLACATPPARAEAPAVDAPAADASRDAFLAARGLRYQLSELKQPRPLRIHALRVDLDHPRIALAAVVADDPDGAGPAEAALEPPTTMADREKAAALVNANPWAALPDSEGKRTTTWTPGLPVDILGLAVSGGAARSPAAQPYCGFWIDGAGKAHIGSPEAGADVREGVAGFSQVLRAGETVNADAALHPRTALGLDAGGRTLWLAVIDGRQPGHSEGMTTVEVAELMRGLGCRDAVNLDGGGSSILVLEVGTGRRRVVNDPSTKVLGRSVPRPIPVALAVRERGGPADAR